MEARPGRRDGHCSMPSHYHPGQSSVSLDIPHSRLQGKETLFSLIVPKQILEWRAPNLVFYTTTSNYYLYYFIEEVFSLWVFILLSADL